MAANGARVLVVGAGFAGAVHARTLAEAGVCVSVIDKRPHLAGNAYDFVGDDGVRIHRYGPHLFHTANADVLAWVHARGRWTVFNHQVRALLPGGDLVPIPINRDTINAVFGTAYQTSEDVQAHLARVSVKAAATRNAAEHLHSQIGVELTDLFFRPYTKKMWGLDLEDLSPAIVKRIPLRTDRDNSYFPTGQTQLMPVGGYTAFFEQLLDHPLIETSLDTAFDIGMLADVDHCFASLPIDEFYRFDEGELAYRSLRFHHRSATAAEVNGSAPQAAPRDYAVINYTDTGPYTRETAWHVLPDHLCVDTGRRTLTREEPCDYRDNHMERYYPVKTADGSNDDVYRRYVERSRADAAQITFIGRCGTYRYLDMDQVISQSLASARVWLAANDRRAA